MSQAFLCDGIRTRIGRYGVGQGAAMALERV